MQPATAERKVFAAARLSGQPLVLVGLALAGEDTWHFTLNKETGNAEKF